MEIFIIVGGVALRGGFSVYFRPVAVGDSSPVSSLPFALLPRRPLLTIITITSSAASHSECFVLLVVLLLLSAA